MKFETSHLIPDSINWNYLCGVPFYCKCSYPSSTYVQRCIQTRAFPHSYNISCLPTPFVVTCDQTLADLGGRARHAPPLRVQILSFWHAKFSKRSRLGGPRPPLRGPRPPLREILDPPLPNTPHFNILISQPGILNIKVKGNKKWKGIGPFMDAFSKFRIHHCMCLFLFNY